MKIPKEYNNKKMCVNCEDQKVVPGMPRCYWSKKKGRVLVKCSDCDNKFDMYFLRMEGFKSWLEVNGVMVDVEWLKGLIKLGLKLDEEGFPEKRH